MIYHNENGKEFNISELDKNVLGRGCYGKIYFYQDKLAKLFNFNKYVDINLIREISHINSPNIYRIDDLLFNRHNEFSGYTMEYIISDKISLLEVNSSYFVRNYLGLMDLANNLNLHGIQIIDLNYDNLIINRNGIKIIDCDEYQFRRICNNSIEIKLTIQEHIYNDFNNIGLNYNTRNVLFNEICDLINGEEINKLLDYKSLLDYSYKKVL